jgi:hypothetical protein
MVVEFTTATPVALIIELLERLVFTNCIVAPPTKLVPVIVIPEPPELDPEVGLMAATVGGVSSNIQEFMSMLSPQVVVHCAVDIGAIGDG